MSDLKINFINKEFSINSFEDASHKWRQFILTTGIGNSQIPVDPIISQYNPQTKRYEPIAFISYNGRVWRGTKYAPGQALLYSPF